MLYPARAATAALILVIITRICESETDCDITIKSTDDGIKNGTFESPNHPQLYDHNLRCIYKFIGTSNEKVKLSFTFFEVKGIRPRCLHDYVDVYTQVSDPDVDLVDRNFHGRYCGEDKSFLPHLWVSVHNIIIVGFYTDHKASNRGFRGEYEFFSNEAYQVGIPKDRNDPNSCEYTITSSVYTSGTLLSPTFPGQYPDDLFCIYKFRGKRGQRIKFTFVDLDLYSGGEYCPFDAVKIFDGYTNNPKDKIGTFCGRKKGISVFSTSEALQVEFSTKSGRPEPPKVDYIPYWLIYEDMKIRMKGFNATFEFSDDFVDLEFIRRSGGKHLVGTECDQVIQSKGKTNGTVVTPNYPYSYPLGVKCHFYIDGYTDKRRFENVQFSFETFDVPPPGDKCLAGSKVDVYMKGKDPTKVSPDLQLCGTGRKGPWETTNSRLLVVLDTTNGVSGRGFSLAYKFHTYYAIPGTQASRDNCHFLYYSKSGKRGYFKTPRYPSYYMPNEPCIYDFIGMKNEQIRITFDNFRTEDRYKNCSTDYVELFNVLPTIADEWNLSKIGHYCGGLLPGPVMSDRTVNRLRVIFHSDDQVLLMGFVALYEFVPARPKNKGCFRNTTGSGGVITSPDYPKSKYKKDMSCDWLIRTTDPHGRVMLQIEAMSLEGVRHGESMTGCSKAVILFYTDTLSLPTHWYCGLKKALKNNTIILSKANEMRVRFITASSAVGGDGFRFTWTEIVGEKVAGQNVKCDGGFQCEKSGYCISMSLTCNRINNCGLYDESDEEAEHCKNNSEHHVLKIALGVVISLVVFTVVLVCFLHKRRKLKKKRSRKQIEVKYVTPGISGSRAGDRLLLQERTEKVSIV